MYTINPKAVYDSVKERLMPTPEPMKSLDLGECTQAQADELEVELRKAAVYSSASPEARGWFRELAQRVHDTPNLMPSVEEMQKHGLVAMDDLIQDATDAADEANYDSRMG